MSEQVYLVRELSYVYNDEVYEASEEDGYKPLVLYRSKDKAQLVAFEKNIHFLTSNNLEYYGRDLDNIVNDGKLIQLFSDVREFFSEYVEDVDWKSITTFISNLPLDDQIKAVNCFYINPFTVQPIMIEDD